MLRTRWLTNNCIVNTPRAVSTPALTWRDWIVDMLWTVNIISLEHVCIWANLIFCCCLVVLCYSLAWRFGCDYMSLSVSQLCFGLRLHWWNGSETSGKKNVFAPRLNLQVP
jgi:hypothetical protein